MQSIATILPLVKLAAPTPFPASFLSPRLAPPPPSAAPPLPPCAPPEPQPVRASLRWRKSPRVGDVEWFFPAPNVLFDAICSELGPYAWAVWCYLSRRCDRRTGRWSVDYHTLAAATKMSPSHARRMVALLVEGGYLSKQQAHKRRGADAGGRERWEQFPNTYTVQAFASGFASAAGPASGSSAAPRNQQGAPPSVQGALWEQPHKKTPEESASRKQQHPRPEAEPPAPEPQAPEDVAVALSQGDAPASPTPAPGAPASTCSPPPAPPEPQAEAALLAALQAEVEAVGVKPAVARRLCRQAAPEAIRLQLDCLHAREPRQPAALLVRAIIENWEPPARFEPQQQSQGAEHGQPQAQTPAQAQEREARREQAGERARRLREREEAIARRLLETLEPTLRRKTLEFVAGGADLVQHVRCADRAAFDREMRHAP